MIHHEAPGSKAIVGGLFGRPLQIPPNIASGDFLSRLYRARRVKQFFDGVALHPYVADAQAMGAQLTNLRRIMRRHHDGATPLYVTELGWGSASGPTRWQRGLWGQANQLSKAFAMLSANRVRWGVRGAWWFTWTDEGGSCVFCHSAGLLTAQTGSEARLVPVQRMDRRRRRTVPRIGSGDANRRRSRSAAVGAGIVRLRSDFKPSKGAVSMAFSVPDLPYAYDALEPHIDEETMRIHHDKHHQAYVDKANAALEGTEWADRDVEDVLRNLSALPGDKQAAVRNNAGGHYNHTPLLADDGPRRRRRAGRRPRLGDRRDLRLLRLLQGGVQKRRHRPLRLRLGLAGQGLLRPRGGLDPEPGLADLRRHHAAARRATSGSTPTT